MLDIFIMSCQATIYSRKRSRSSDSCHQDMSESGDKYKNKKQRSSSMDSNSSSDLKFKKSRWSSPFRNKASHFKRKVKSKHKTKEKIVCHHSNSTESDDKILINKSSKRWRYEEECTTSAFSENVLQPNERSRRSRSTSSKRSHYKHLDETYPGQVRSVGRKYDHSSSDDQVLSPSRSPAGNRCNEKNCISPEQNPEDGGSSSNGTSGKYAHFGMKNKFTHTAKESSGMRRADRKSRLDILISKKEKVESSSETDSEQEIMFDWANHRWELNKLFFQSHDIIKQGSEEYIDFFKFLNKYQALHKQKKIEKCVNKQLSHALKNSKKHLDCKQSSKYYLPLEFNNRYLVNFGIKGETVESLMRRLPPLDLDEKNTRLSRKKVEEFKNIILLYLNFIQKQSFQKLQKLRKGQSELPIAQYEENIIRTVSENSITLIAGDTGCGKSTQVPQYLMKAGYSNIACTQPRRIACISLCKRVAHETLDEFGSLVGYQIRFERKRTDHTKILFLTEGLLLRQVNTDPTLSNYDVIILDEIHERHLHTDFLLGVVKCLLMQITGIKIILMSATINLNLFSNYFLGKAPVIQVPGRLFPISLQYFPIPLTDQTTKSDKLNPAPYIRILQLIDKKYKEDDRGDVLMFLSGFSEINTVVEAAKLYAQQSKKWVILSLHSNLSVSDQEKVFDIPPEGVRKCIVSTNIAETSITIDGVRFVVDSGKVKEMSYDAVCKMQKLKEFNVSQASAEQRKGRAGRTGPGVCFRLYSEEQYNAFDAYSTPEIQRVPLDSLALQMIAMGLPDIRLFPFIEPPPMESLEVSIKALKSQAAITPEEQLTTTGRLLSQLPVDVTIGKMLLMGSLFHQAEATLSLAASMSVQSVFTNRAQRDPACLAAAQELVCHNGDPFTLLRAYRAWLQEKTSEGRGQSSQRWCRTRGLEEQRFYEITKLRHQFSQLLQQVKLHEAPRPSSHASNTAAERARRHGELQQLRHMRRQLDQQAGRKTKVLKMDQDGAVLSDGESETVVDPKHLDFSIKNDAKQLRHLLENADVQSFKDVIMLKIILSSGLYPNVAIADEHNTYKPNSEQLFHTPSKPFAVLHPTGVLARQPDLLQLPDSDIVELPGFTHRNPAATRHQILMYVSLLETNKPFLMNTFRVPTSQTLLLFAQSIDTNADMSSLVCDNFIELRFPDPVIGQNLLLKAVRLRAQWNSLLEMKLKLSQEDSDELELIGAACKLERILSHGLLELYMWEPLFSQRRLLAADVKVLHKGPGLDDVVLDSNPFTGQACVPNDTKGGVNLTENVVYNSLLEPCCESTTLTETETVCPECDEMLHCRILARLEHIIKCADQGGGKKRRNEDEELGKNDPNAKKFFCDECNKTLWLTLKDIFAHKKSHS